MNIIVFYVIQSILLIVSGILLYLIIKYIKINRARLAWKKAEKEYRVYYKAIVTQPEDHSLYKVPTSLEEIMNYEEENNLPDTKKLLANNPRLYELFLTDARAGIRYCKLCPESLVLDEKKYEKLEEMFFLIEDEEISSQLSTLLF